MRSPTIRGCSTCCLWGSRWLYAYEHLPHVHNPFSKGLNSWMDSFQLKSTSTPPPSVPPNPHPPPKKTVCNLVAGCGGGGGGWGGRGGWWGVRGDFVNKLLRTTPQYNGEACGCSVHVHVHVGLCTRRFVHKSMGLSQRHHFKGLTLLDLTPRTQSDYTVPFEKYLGRHFWSKQFLGRLFF